MRWWSDLWVRLKKFLIGTGDSKREPLKMALAVAALAIFAAFPLSALLMMLLSFAGAHAAALVALAVFLVSSLAVSLAIQGLCEEVNQQSNYENLVWGHRLALIPAALVVSRSSPIVWLMVAMLVAVAALIAWQKKKQEPKKDVPKKQEPKRRQPRKTESKQEAL